ncbi:ADAM 17 protease isoform X2 [Biomphalaria glabrata]|nr:ADAM 17 protease isoform X2 [Biomphalaria glabrata]
MNAIMNLNMIVYFALLFSIITYFISLVYCVGNLNYFETFTYIGVSTKVKRYKDAEKSVREITFQVFNRSFHLLLQAASDVLRDGFTAYLVDNETTTSYVVDKDQVFTGNVFDKPDVEVSAHREGLLWSIQIHEENETYIIEPAKNILNASHNPNNDTHIAYRNSDFNAQNFGKCGVIDAETGSDETYTHFKGKYLLDQMKFKVTNRTRFKRSMGDTCAIYMVGDFDFFTKRCHSNYHICTALMISLVHNADRIFRRSPFEDHQFKIYENIGLQIGMLILYTTPTYSGDVTMKHFNAQGIQWNSYTKLDSFEYFMSFRKSHFCLTHLVTSYPFPLRILGLANRQSICMTTKAGKPLKSTSLISTIDNEAGPLTTYQMGQVFAHGHNFGSHHDPYTSQCSHSESEGGQFIMWYKVGVGTQPNNKLFSPCSLKSIGATLQNKYLSHCLITKRLHLAFCGDGIVNEGEECDAGAIGIVDADLCCTKYCTLQPGAECSEMNTECCLNCRLANKGTLCSDNKGIDCKRKSYCTGKSFGCPEPARLPDGTTCAEGGSCLKGICRGFCAMKSYVTNLSLKACFCRNDQDACRWCCYDNSDPNNPGPCEPHSPMLLKDGQPCFYGYCKSGECQALERQLERGIGIVWLSIKNANYNLVEFLKDNFVVVIILSSLALCIPIWLCIHYLDKKSKNNQVVEMDKAISLALSVKSSKIINVVKVSKSQSDRDAVDKLSSKASKSQSDRDAVAKLSCKGVDDLNSFYRTIVNRNEDLSQTLLILSPPKKSLLEGLEPDRYDSRVDDVGYDHPKKKFTFIPNY